MVRLPSGQRRVPVKFKRQALTAVEEEELTSQKKAGAKQKKAPEASYGAPPAPGGGFDLFNKGDDEACQGFACGSRSLGAVQEQEEPGDEVTAHGRMSEDEATWTPHVPTARVC